MKKLLFTVVCAVLTSTMLCAGAISANADNSLALEGNINFEIPESWAANNSIYYAHIWDGINFEGLYEWQTKNEKMTVDSDEKIASYYVPRGNWNLLVISSNNGEQPTTAFLIKIALTILVMLLIHFFKIP